MTTPYNLKDSRPGEAITLLLYGGSGVGKTYFAGTCGSRSLILNTGFGLETLKSKAFKNAYPDANPIIVDIREEVDKKGIVTVAKAFDLVCDVIDEFVNTRRDEFDNIIIDDASTLASFAQNKGIELNLDSGKTKGTKRKIPMPVLQDYGTEQSILKWFFSMYTTLAKASGFNLIVTAHDRSVYTSGKGEEPRLRKVFPNFVGKDYFAPAVIPAFFDEVWYLYLVGGKRRFRTQPNEIYVAKTRHGGIFKEVEEFSNWNDVTSKIKE